MRRCLESSVLLSGISDTALRAVLARATLQRYEGRKLLFRSGDAATWVGVIASGRVRLSRKVPGRELTLDYRAPGDCVGEGAFLDGVYHCDGVAVERVDVVEIPLEVLQQLLAREAAFGQRVVKVLAKRTMSLEHRIEGFLTRTVESRLAEFLLSMAEQHGVSDSRGVFLSVRFTHQEIANYVGATRETVTLALGELRRKNIVLMVQRRIIITDSVGLAARV